MQYQVIDIIVFDEGSFNLSVNQHNFELEHPNTTALYMASEALNLPTVILSSDRCAV